MPYKVRQFLSSFIVYRKRGEKAIENGRKCKIGNNTKKKSPSLGQNDEERARRGKNAGAGGPTPVFSGKTMYIQSFYREKLSNKVEKRGILGRLLFLQ